MNVSIFKIILIIFKKKICESFKIIVFIVNAIICTSTSVFSQPFPYYQEYLNRLQKGENVNSIINQIKNGDIDILNTFLPKPVKWDNGTIPKVAVKLINKANKLNLSEHPYWLRLLHYKSTHKNGEGSEIISKNFFLAEDGMINPKSELEKTIASFFVNDVNNHDNHAKCRFIARYEWLSSKLNFNHFDFPNIKCKSFIKWIGKNQIINLKLVFVSSYLENPGSLFGHLLLRIDAKDGIFSPLMLNTTLNYGAIVPQNENPFAYIYNGIFGNYKSQFSDERFHMFDNMYGEKELRDMWEYNLNLSDDQKKRIVYHAWELIHGVQFDYYFFKENCAYRIAELIDMGWENNKILNKNKLWSSPIEVLLKHSNTKINDKPILYEEPELLMSRLTKLNHRIKYVSKQEKNIINHLYNDYEYIDNANFKELKDNKIALILDVYFDYIQIYPKTKNKENESKNINY